MVHIKPMTTTQADKIIKAGQPVKVRGPLDPRGFVAVFVRRDRWNIYSADGGTFDRGDLVLVTPHPHDRPDPTCDEPTCDGYLGAAK